MDYSDLLLTVTAISVRDIPKVDPANASAEENEILNGMLAFFQNSPSGRPLPPLAYQDIGIKAVTVMLTLVGQKIWSAFYADRAVLETDYIPWQLLEMLRHAVHAASTFGAKKLVVEANALKAAVAALAQAR